MCSLVISYKITIIFVSRMPVFICGGPGKNRILIIYAFLFLLMDVMVKIIINNNIINKGVMTIRK